MKGKKILLGVTGSIAAYKTALLIRLFKKAGAEVRVIMTPAACDFITPLTLATLSKEPVLTDYYNPEDGSWNNHVEFGMWADLILIAPATANTLAHLRQGVCDSLLLAIYLSARCPVWAAPAMDLDMWTHPTTRENILELRKKGLRIIEPASGELASGLSGEGRMEEPEAIFHYVNEFFQEGSSLKGIKALVTAGPTYEAIDPVRYIGNHSSGKMGFALAERLAELGAEVHLITGPVYLSTKHPDIRISRVVSAAEMNAACSNIAADCQLIIMAAAIADYRPASVNNSKIKKTAEALLLELEATEDVLAGLGKNKKSGQILVGFALETDQELENAKKKLINKNLDLIVLNSLNDKGAGFGVDTNKVTIISKDGKVWTSATKSKKEIAGEIIQQILPLI